MNKKGFPMFKNETLILNAFYVTGVLILSGCTTVTPTTVKEVTSNSSGYISKNFTAQSVRPNVLREIPSDRDTGVNFQKLIITQVGEVEDSGYRKFTLAGKSTFVKTANGLLQTTLEISNNDIPYEVRHSVSYKGMINLKWQIIRVEGKYANPIYEVKNVTKFDSIPTNVGDEFVMKATSAKQEQLDNFNVFQRKCRASKSDSAMLLHPKLSGQAVTMDCEYLSNDTLMSRSKWILLKDYGVAVMMENKSSTRKDTLAITNVEIDN
jgi:hypothetical protein